MDNSSYTINSDFGVNCQKRNSNGFNSLSRKSLVLKLSHHQRYRSDTMLDKISTSPCVWADLVKSTKKELAQQAMVRVLKDSISPRLDSLIFSFGKMTYVPLSIDYS